MEHQPTPIRRVCGHCGAASLALSPGGIRCTVCETGSEEAQEAPAGSAGWLRQGGGAAAGAFAALDEVFNPGAARARERVRADHERRIPVPSPGDDALRTGRLVIRVPARPQPLDVHSPTEE